MPLTAVEFFKMLADKTRLACLLMLVQQDELCVCEFMQALDLSQPMVSRHLALLRKSGLLLDEKQGQWVYYRLNPELPDWCHQVLNQTCEAETTRLVEAKRRLESFGDRPTRIKVCC